MNNTTLNLDYGDGEGPRRRRPNHRDSRKLMGSALFACAIGVSVGAVLVTSRKGSSRGDELMVFLKGKKSPATSSTTKPSSTGKETLGRRLEESRSTMQEPDLTIVEDQDGTPLGECQGGCEEDGHCEV